MARKIKSQLCEYFNAVVLYKEKRLTLERTDWNDLVVCDGYSTDWIMPLSTGDGDFVCDGTFLLSESMRGKIRESVKGLI